MKIRSFMPPQTGEKGGHGFNDRIYFARLLITDTNAYGFHHPDTGRISRNNMKNAVLSKFIYSA